MKTKQLAEHADEFKATAVLPYVEDLSELLRRCLQQQGVRAVFKSETSLRSQLARPKDAVFFCKKENSALLEHTCLTNHTIGWDNSKIITTNRRYHQRLCLEARHINSAHVPLNRDDGGLLPDAYLLVRKKGR